MKAVSFRPTAKAQANLNAYMKKKTLSSSQAIIKILETLDLEEKPKQEKGDFFTLPPFLFCEETRAWHLRGNLLDPDNDSGCHNAKCRKTCGAWKLRELFVITTPKSKR